MSEDRREATEGRREATEGRRGASESLRGATERIREASEARVATEGRRGRLGYAAHPYTQLLLASTPRLHRRVSELAFIPGTPPDLVDPPAGCRFAPRCPFAKPKCRAEEPPIASLAALTGPLAGPQAGRVGSGHLVACWKAMEDPDYERQ